MKNKEEVGMMSCFSNSLFWITLKIIDSEKRKIFGVQFSKNWFMMREAVNGNTSVVPKHIYKLL